MLRISIEGLLGYTNAAHMMMETFKGASNVILTDNPEFTLSDFQAVFPIFPISSSSDNTSEGDIPLAVYNLFKGMADGAIKYDRYFTNWKYLMCLYIAHYLTLYIQTQNGDDNMANALRGALPFGIASSKSVDGLSVSYDFMGVTDGMNDYGTWKLTLYGQQLITLTKIFGHGGMWVNG